MYKINQKDSQFWNLHRFLFRSDVKANEVEFRHIKKYLIDENKNPYEDNKDFVDTRYKYAKTVLNNLLKDGSSYDFRTHNYNDNSLVHPGTLRPQ